MGPKGLRRIVASDDYRPLPFGEISELVAPDVAARLDETKGHGVQWYSGTTSRRSRGSLQ